MNHKQADEIIKNYKPNKGFFNLSKKPDTLTKREYAIILDTQNALARANKTYKNEEIRELHKHDFGVAKELKAKLQQVVFEHWGLGILEEEE